VSRQSTAATTPEQNIISKPISLESDAAVVALLHELVERKDEVMGPRIKSAVMKSLLDNLLAKNVKYTSDSLLARKRYLVKYYREKRKSGDDKWRFYRLIGQLVGDVEYNGEFAELTSSSDRKFYFFCDFAPSPNWITEISLLLLRLLQVFYLIMMPPSSSFWNTGKENLFLIESTTPGSCGKK